VHVLRYRSEDFEDGNQRLREVIRLLNLALDDCQRLLGETDNGRRQSKQDNDPPSGSDKAQPS